MRTCLPAAAALAALSALPAHAETPVDELVVTAARLPTDPKVITGAHVIDRAEIEARNVSFAADLLSTIPGVSVARTGAFGGVAAIRIRGAGPDKTLVLIDGVPVGDAGAPNGDYDPASLQTGDLERVEVLSGPQGSLWGSEAIGGVVSFTTRELDGLEVAAEGGSFATARGFAGAGTKADRYALSASVTAFRTDGISKADTGTEKDGFKTWTGNLSGRFNVSEQVKLDARLRYSRATIDIDGFPPPTFALGDTPDRAKSRAWQGFARATVDALGLTHELSFSAYDLRRKNISSFPSVVDADRQVIRWTAAKGDLFVIGAERQESDANLSTGLSRDLSNTAVFAVGQAKWERLTLTGSVRRDDPEAYEAKTTGRLAAAVDLGFGFNAVASAGTGFKTPTVSQVVCDFCFAPPVPLRPEKAEGYDLRLGWASDRISTSVTAYRLLVRDQIAYVASRYVNIAKTSSNGLEAEFDARVSESLRVKLAYAWTDAIDRSTDRSLLRVPDHSGSAAVFWDEGPWSASVTVRGESSQADTARDGFSRARRPGFVTADVAGAYDVTAQLSVTARVENLTDKRFEEVLGYREPGIAAYVGVRFRN
ncbi:TonB-dependent siderophore receptor [Phenylobacterium sp.]|uniref:TonB-dependent receptor plug domain-containing protein n=1 Tax=Phenylobacterium sp. TaxID=1871053 RepID=UPI0025D7671C|nr:TonB-dependent receptor [Phenylobacterium sp.]MBX3483872.1 TonB-dependent receptor [Phenylobacterium sp.]MCW5758326.1 TonB-dependent receptor [Phenylobacterium sp.]